MRLSTQFKVILVTFSIVLVIVASLWVVTAEGISKARTQENFANNVVQGASELSYLASDYVIYRENQQLERWQERYSLFSSHINSLSVDTLEQQALVRNVRLSAQNMKEVFDSIVLSIENIENQDLTMQALQLSWSRMTIQSQAMITDASRLAELMRVQVDELNILNFAGVFAIIVAFGALLGAIYLQSFRRTLKSIVDLEVGAAIIGSGDLDYKFKEGRTDEIGHLSMAFNGMTARLKTVTASKSDLEREIEERKKVEEALKKSEQFSRQKAEELQALQVKLEDKAAEVEEYANQMEELAQERLEKLKDSERLAAIGATAGMVGHDIRNPLQAITSDAFLAKAEIEALPDSEQKRMALESIEEIEKNTEYINKIVQDLQDYARPLNPRIEETDLKQIIESFVAKNGLPKDINLSMRIDEDARKIRVDSYYVNRIMYNLITNSIQAMPQGGKLTIESYKEGEETVLTIKDTGIGIPKNIQDKMFTLMFTTKSKGQGFGLPVVKRMTESLGGTVTFESQEGKGTTFKVRLPTRNKL